MAEDGEEFGHLPDWQQEEVELANDIVENDDKYALLPTSFDVHEYNMIEKFCYRLSDQKEQDILLQAISGKGAFRRFKDRINQLGIAEQWYDFRDQCYKEIAKAFCQSKNIDY
ncbi:UPF0158 family protein [Bacillus solitudinis]|uniref:UPF0158 family protein n=1 Tax=Bacillus solitudinis TaxID=2014074 RepID=UPI000C24CB16|nr:UPF0158 family protein [Bacillus solitudinis]